MRTLIIPSAGRSMLMGMPKWLLRHPDGNHLIKKCVCGLDLSEFDRIIITILKEDEEKYNASSIIALEFSENKNIEIFILDKQTSGPAETVYKTIIEKSVEGKVVIKDSDVFTKIHDCKFDNFVAGLNLIECDADLPNIRNKSFVIVNEQNQILDIIEKQIKSDLICLGLYGIREASDFIETYNALSDNDYGIQSLYVSHIIAYLIGMQGKIFNYVKVLEYENWETERDWENINRKFGTYFIDIDRLIDDIDSGCSNYNERMEIEPIYSLQMIEKLQMNGAKIVLFTSRSNNDYKKIMNMIGNYSITPLDIVYDCSYAHKRIISNKDELKKECFVR